MAQNSLFTSAENLLNDIQKIIADNKSKPNKISQIEIDLLKDKVKTLYDTLIKFDIPTQTPIQTTEIPPKTKKPKTIKETPVLDLVDVEENIQESETDNEEIKTEDIIIQQTQPEEIREETEAIDLFSTPEERISDESKSVVDKISEEMHEESIADKIKNDRINDIKSAIGINDKFFFINELFDGNMKDYIDAVEHLDEFDSYSEASGYLITFADENDLDKESAAFVQLSEFVENKFN